MSLLTLRQLEIFEQTVKSGGFRRCAEHIGISLVSVSDHIKELEERLGVKLFERRNGSQALLTKEGTEIYNRVSDILSDLNDLIWHYEPSSRKKSIKICIPPYLMQYLISDFEDFTARNPEISLVFINEALSPAEIKEKLSNRSLDIAYFYDVGTKSNNEAEIILVEKLGFFVGNNHRLAGKNIVSIHDLDNCSFISLPSEHYLRKITDAAIANIGISEIKTTNTSPEYALLLAMTRHNLGVLCMFENNAKHLGSGDGIEMLKLDRSPPEVQIIRMARHAWRHDNILKELEGKLSSRLSKIND